MRARTAGSAVIAAVAAFLVVGVLATEGAGATGIEFSVFVGIPAGLTAGVAAAAVVLLRLEEAEPTRRRPAVGLAGFGVAFVLVLLVAVGALGLRNSVAFPIAAAIGLAGAAAAVASDRRV